MATTKTTREEVETALAETRVRAQAAYTAVLSAEGLHRELRQQQKALEVELRALNFAPNATMTRDFFGPFSMDEVVATHLREGERVHVEKGDGALVVTRQDGRTFRVADELVAFDRAEAPSAPVDALFDRQARWRSGKCSQCELPIGHSGKCQP